MSLFNFARFEPAPGKEGRLRDELLLILELTRAEAGCVRIQLYESTRGVKVFFIHSEWTNEPSFDAHPKLPHMTRFLGLVDGLTVEPLKAVLTKQIA